MKRIRPLIIIISIAVLFNLFGNTGLQLRRFSTPAFWIWTGGLTMILVIGTLLVQFRLLSLASFWEKKYPTLKLIEGEKLYFKQLPLFSKIWGIGSTVSILMSIYLFFIFMFSYVREGDTMALFISYMKYYASRIALICLVYTAYVFIKGKLSWIRTVFKTRFVSKVIVIPVRETVLETKEIIKEVEVPVERVIVKEVKVVPPHVLDEHIVISSLFEVLFHVEGLGPIFNACGAPRMFDVPFYYSSADTKEIILVNGERRKADRFMKELEKRGLDKWYFKISNNYSVNMMLVYYPIAHNVDRLVFHREVFDCLRQNLTELAIQKELVLTTWIKKNKKLVVFLDNINDLRHTGWDDYIPLSAKPSQFINQDKL